MNCVQHKTQQTWTEEHVAERTRDRTLKQWDRTRSTSVRTLTGNRNSRHECLESKHHAPTRNKAFEHARSRTLTWKHDMTVVSGLCHKTHEWHQTEVTEPWHIVHIFFIIMKVPSFRNHYNLFDSRNISDYYQLKTILHCNSKHVMHQTTAYCIITSQPLGVLWQHLQSQILTTIHKKSPGLVTVKF